MKLNIKDILEMYDINVDEYQDECNKEPESNLLCRFDIGDEVLVVNNGETYTTYKDLFIGFNAMRYVDKWDYDETPQRGLIGKVVANGRHCSFSSCFVVMIEADDKVYLIDQKGLILHKKGNRYGI